MGVPIMGSLSFQIHSSVPDDRQKNQVSIWWKSTEIILDYWKSSWWDGRMRTFFQGGYGIWVEYWKCVGVRWITGHRNCPQRERVFVKCQQMRKCIMRTLCLLERKHTRRWWDLRWQKKAGTVLWRYGNPQASQSRFSGYQPEKPCWQFMKKSDCLEGYDWSKRKNWMKKWKQEACDSGIKIEGIHRK